MENKQTAMQLVDFSNPNADKIKSASTAKPMQNKQTAVDFLLRELRIEDLAKGEQLSVVLHICKEAKEMEKQQIMQAVYDAMGTNFDPNMGRAELYYNEVYGNKTADT